MLRIYVAGKYSDNNVVDVLKNIGMGERVCADLFVAGYAPFCPWHDKSYVMLNPELEFSVQQFYDYSIAWLKVSDAMFLLPNWKESKGTLKEIEIAKEQGIPVFETIDELDKWALWV
jgi:hypothetical protein